MLEKNDIKTLPVLGSDVFSCVKLTRERFCKLYYFRTQFISNPFTKHDLLDVLSKVSATNYEWVLLNGYFHESAFYLIITNERFTDLLGIVCFNDKPIQGNAE